VPVAVSDGAYTLWLMTRLLALLALIVGVTALAVGCGDSGDSAAQGSSSTAAATTSTPTTSTGDEHSDTDAHTDGETTGASASDILFPPTPAPELGLRDHLGREVTTAQFRGKAMLVTFVYAGCPDICPLIISNMRRTLDRLGPRAEDVQVIAVSVDPEGDTPEVITSYLKSQKMTGRMRWLVGSRHDLEHAWSRWGIATRIPRDNPDLVEHAAPIYGVDTKGTISTIYDSRFTARDVLRDIPELLGT
jgi:protein SCO1